jgi:hypothetical protein
MTTTATTAPASELILVRLLTAAKTKLSPSKVRSDVGRFFRRPPTAEEWQAYINDLVAAGLLTVRPYRLTDAGRALALERLGLNELPARANWPALRDGYLVPALLGASADQRSVAASAEGLPVLLLRRRYGLRTGTTLAQVVEELICKELGFSEETNVKDLSLLMLRRLLKTDERLDIEQLRKQLVRHAVNARNVKVDSLRAAVLQDWVDGENPRPERPISAAEDKRAPEPGGFDLPTFAETVRAAARHSSDGRFGDNKVFINHLWRRLQHEPNFPRLDLPAFKGRLVEANHAGLLRLERADLVQAMNPTDVQESATSYENALFHFVLIERERP